MTSGSLATTPSRRRRRRVLPGVIALVVVLVVAWAGWAFKVVQHPTVDRPARVDAVLVLGGHDGPERTQRALDLVRGGYTDTVVISLPHGTGDRLARGTCEDPPAGVDVVCFDPDPTTTRGEARELGRLVDQHHWTRVAVVTSLYHVSRARMIVGRCVSGTVLMVPSQEPISAKFWAYEWLYQTVGYVKAEVLRGC